MIYINHLLITHRSLRLLVINNKSTSYIFPQFFTHTFILVSCAYIFTIIIIYLYSYSAGLLHLRDYSPTGTSTPLRRPTARGAGASRHHEDRIKEGEGRVSPCISRKYGIERFKGHSIDPHHTDCY